jgi:hypothetical protein
MIIDDVWIVYNIRINSKEKGVFWLIMLLSLFIKKYRIAPFEQTIHLHYQPRVKRGWFFDPARVCKEEQ